jgi:hypothetical protein
MDLTAVIGFLAALIVLWAIALVVFWVLRPKGVSAREILGLVPDVLRLLQSIIGTGPRRLMFDSSWSGLWPGSSLRST